MKTIIQCAALALIAVSSIAEADELTSAFLKKHCLRCHGSEDQNADRRFDTLAGQIKTLDDLERYQEIVDQLNLQNMPPEDEVQPTAEARAKYIAHLTQRITTAHSELNTSGGHSVLRRLNSWEYRQTIGELLEINVDVWDPTEEFPEEVRIHGFDNNGSGLVTSGRLMDHYFVAAEEAIRRATQFGDRPPSKKYTQQSPFYFSGKSANDLPKLFKPDRFRFIPDTPYTDLYGRHYRGGHIGFMPLLQQGGVAHSGIYTVRVRAAAVGRVHDYGNALGDFRNGDPLVMELASVDRRGSVESSGNVSKMTSLARIELTNGEPEWFEWDVYMEAGYEPEVRFRNGPLSAKRMVRLLTTKAADKPEFKPFVGMKAGTQKANGVLRAYQGPRLRIWEIQIEGPHVETWPPTGHHAMYGNLEPAELNATTIAQRLESFAEKAFRRSPGDGELEPIQQLTAGKLNEGVEPLHALQLGCQAILCSPGFLYLNLREGELDEVALASRLSYFLWSSPPDETLLKLAAAGKLRSELSAQVTRMLDDSRSDRFVKHFVRRWLDLDNIGTMPPSGDFLVYYRDNLETAMRAETETFFRHVLDNNLSPKEFLDTDYSFLNRELALHYGIEGVEGNKLQRVSLQGSRRGGLLGHGAFLTASANGVDTSPVVRGIYARYLASVRELDHGFGLIMQLLKTRGIEDNTLVIFMGDNGEALLRGKGTLFDRGTHVPLMIRWPGRVKPGSNSSALVCGTDLGPTILSACGTKPLKEMTGVSFFRQLIGEKTEDRRYVFAERGWHWGPITRTDGLDLSRSITSTHYRYIYNALPNRSYTPVDMPDKDAWKAIQSAHAANKLSPLHQRLYFQNPRPVVELYDLRNDPLELNNLAGKKSVAEMEQTLREELESWMIREHDFLPLPTHALQNTK